MDLLNDLDTGIADTFNPLPPFGEPVSSNVVASIFFLHSVPIDEILDSLGGQLGTCPFKKTGLQQDFCDPKFIIKFFQDSGKVTGASDIGEMMFGLVYFLCLLQINGFGVFVKSKEIDECVVTSCYSKEGETKPQKIDKKKLVKFGASPNVRFSGVNLGSVVKEVPVSTTLIFGSGMLVWLYRKYRNKEQTKADFELYKKRVLAFCEQEEEEEDKSEKRVKKRRRISRSSNA